MAFVSDLILQVRETLQDVAGDRHTDARMIRAINLGVLDLRRVRPDFWVGRYHAPVFQAAAAGDVYDLPDDTIPLIVAYATGHVAMADDEENSAALSDANYKQYREGSLT